MDEIVARSGKDKKGLEMAKKMRRFCSSLKVEFMKRFAFALASVCFVLVGVPLGIRSHRKESSIGMAISLAVALGYYMVIILMLSCDELYAIRPELLIFAPALVCCAFGCWLLRRNT